MCLIHTALKNRVNNKPINKLFKPVLLFIETFKELEN